MSNAEVMGERKASLDAPSKGFPAPRRDVAAARPVEARPTVPAPRTSDPGIWPEERRRTPTKVLSRLVGRVVVLDALVIVVSIALAWPLRTLLPELNSLPTKGILLSATLAPILLASWMVLLFFNGASPAAPSARGPRSCGPSARAHWVPRSLHPPSATSPTCRCPAASW